MKPKPSIYYCSQCNIYLQISIVPSPLKPRPVPWVEPKGFVMESCPVCGEITGFTEVEEEGGEV